MRRPAARLVVALVLAAAGGTAAAAGVAEVAAREAGRLESRAGAIAGVADPTAAVRDALASARAALVAGDVGADEADALARVPPRLSGTRLDAAAAAHVLKACARRLRRYADLAGRPAPPREQNARAAMREILEGPDFDLREPEPGTLRALLIRLQRWIVRQIERVARFVELEVPIVRFLLWLAVVGLAVAGLVALDRALRGRAGATRSERPSPEATVDSAPDAEALLAAAEEDLRHGRLARALALAESAAVTALRARGAFPSAPSLTDLEGISWLHDSGGPAGPAFERIATLHDRVVYGGRDAAPEEVGAAIALARTLVPQGAA